jgi:hypothetical protein
MGTSVDMIEHHYGHLLAPHATRSRDILDAIWDGFGRNHLRPQPAPPTDSAQQSRKLRSPLTDSNR